MLLRLLILSTLLLAACGQSGDLYLPDSESPRATPAATPVPNAAPPAPSSP